MTPGSEHQRTAYLALIAVCVLWGTTYLGIRIALESIPPGLVGGLRYTAAGLLLSCFLRFRGEAPLPSSQWSSAAMIGLLTVCIGNGGVIWAEQWVPSGIAAVTVATVPFWMIGMEAFTRDADRLSIRTVAGLLIGFCGILLLVWPEIASANAGAHQYLMGIVALQVACVGWAVGSSLSRRQPPQQNVLAGAAMQMTFGGLFMLAAASARSEWSQWAFTARSVLAEIYLTLVGSIAGYTAYIYALRNLPTATVSLYAYANPLIAVVLGAWLANEPFGPRVIVAAVMVLIGSALVQTPGVADKGTRGVPLSLKLRRLGDRLPGVPGTARRRSPAEPR